MQIKALMFDFGGTIDTGGIHWFQAFLCFYSRHGIEPERDKFRDAYVHTERKLAKEDIKPEMTFYEILKYKFNSHVDYMQKNNIIGPDKEIDAGRILEDSYWLIKRVVKQHRDIISSLSKKFKIAVVSNFYGNLGQVMKEFDLDKYLACHVDSALLGIRKPDPGIWVHALELLGLSPDEAVIIGDSYSNDIEPAKKIGCKAIWLKNAGWNIANIKEKPDYTIEKFKDISNVIDDI